MHEPTIAAILDRVNTPIPSEPDKIAEALIDARDDLRILLEETEHLRSRGYKGPLHAVDALWAELRASGVAEIPAEATKKNLGPTGAVIGALLDEVAEVNRRVSVLEAHSVLDLFSGGWCGVTTTTEALKEEILEQTESIVSARDDFLEHVIALKLVVEECVSYVHYLLPDIDDVYAKLAAGIKEDLFDRLEQFDDLTRTIENCGRHKVSGMARDALTKKEKAQS